MIPTCLKNVSLQLQKDWKNISKYYLTNVMGTFYFFFSIETSTNFTHFTKFMCKVLVRDIFEISKKTSPS